MAKIVIAGRTYSSNLGDGIIAECLQYLFAQVAPEHEIQLLDLGGLETWLPLQPQLFSRRRNYLKRVLLGNKTIYSSITLLRWYASARRRCVLQWDAALSGASLLVIGGGQLLMDNHLRFPLRIHTLGKLAQQRSIPTHFLACGVNRTWSPLARRLFRSIVTQAASISVRDSESQKRLLQLLPQAPLPTQTFDPAIWAAECYPRVDIAESQVRTVGIGVIGLKAVNAHAPAGQKFTEEALLQFWLDILIQIQRSQLPCELFTNGAADDYALAEKVRQEAYVRLGINCSLAPRPYRPVDLVQQIQTYRTVIAARLHANLIALSHGIPTVGIVWDNKVAALYHDINKSHCCLNIYDRDPVDIYALLQASSEQVVSPQILVDFRAQIRATIQSIVMTL